MFQKPFSFEGRIRRTEFGLTFIIRIFSIYFLRLFSSSIIASDSNGGILVYYLFLIPILLFGWAQGAKRCHDLGYSGWYQLIPFFPIYLIFGKGNVGINKFGNDPKIDLKSEILD